MAGDVDWDVRFWLKADNRLNVWSIRLVISDGHDARDLH